MIQSNYQVVKHLDIQQLTGSNDLAGYDHVVIIYMENPIDFTLHSE